MQRIITLHDSRDIVLTETFAAKDDEGERAFREALQEKTVGARACIETPFGSKRIAYFDFIASGDDATMTFTGSLLSELPLKSSF